MLTKTIEPVRLAKLDAQMNGDIPLKTLERLEALCDQGDALAQVALTFGFERSSIPFIRGHITTNVTLVCQRCNQLMTYPIDNDFLLGCVQSEEQAKRLPEAFEPLLIQDESVSAYDMIEDEILLALPMVPKHEVCGG